MQVNPQISPQSEKSEPKPIIRIQTPPIAIPDQNLYVQKLTLLSGYNFGLMIIQIQ